MAQWRNVQMGVVYDLLLEIMKQPSFFNHFEAGEARASACAAGTYD
jgi:hypothetical protein